MIKKILRKVKSSYEGVKLSRKISKCYSVEKSTRKQPADFGLLLNAHSLEKGMSFENVRKDFGKVKASYIIDNAKTYLQNGGNSNAYALRESLSVLERYLAFSKEIGTDVTDLEKKYKAVKDMADYQPTLAGTITLHPMEDVYSKIDKENARYFISSRHSIRSYTDKAVPEDIMNKVIALTLQAPSACNRQPSKIYWTSDKTKVKEIDKYIPGNKGFEGCIYNWAIYNL